MNTALLTASSTEAGPLALSSLVAGSLRDLPLLEAGFARVETLGMTKKFALTRDCTVDTVVDVVGWRSGAVAHGALAANRASPAIFMIFSSYFQAQSGACRQSERHEINLLLSKNHPGPSDTGHDRPGSGPVS